MTKVSDTEYKVSFTIDTSSTNPDFSSMNLEIDAYLPPNIFGGWVPDTDTQTILKISGSVSWSVDDQGNYSSFTVGGWSADQASNIGHERLLSDEIRQPAVIQPGGRPSTAPAGWASAPCVGGGAVPQG